MIRLLKKEMQSFTIFGVVMAAALWATTNFAGASETSVVRLGGDLGQPETKRVTIQQIEALGVVEIETYNPDERRVGVYSGVWLSDLIAAFGTGNTQRVNMTAIDLYEATFERREWEGLRILLATQEDGRHLEIDRKGPMRVIFADYDAKESAYQETIGKWIWMISEIDFSD